MRNIIRQLVIAKLNTKKMLKNSVNSKLQKLYQFETKWPH